MRYSTRRLTLRADSIRVLTDLGAVHGGRPTSFPQCVGDLAAPPEQGNAPTRAK